MTLKSVQISDEQSAAACSSSSVNKNYAGRPLASTFFI